MRRRKIPIVSFVLLGLNVLGLIWEYQSGESYVTYRYGMYQGALQSGEYIRLLTSGFLHFGLLHFASNMFCLVVFGYNLERRIGSFRYAAIYFIALIGGGLLINWTGGSGIHAGASGAIWGLMTATLIYNIRNGINPAYAARGIVVNLVYSFSAGVSWQAHIGGGLAGAAAALALCGREDYNSQPRYFADPYARDGQEEAAAVYDEEGNLIRQEGYPARAGKPVMKTVAVIAAAVAVCAGAIILAASTRDATYAVRSSSPEQYPQITYEQAYSGCFRNGKWEDVSTDDGKLVRFSGIAEFQDGSSDDISFTFRVNDDGTVTVVSGTIGSHILNSYYANQYAIQPFELYLK